MEKAGVSLFDCYSQQSVASTSLRLCEVVSGLTVDILSTFCRVFMVLCVKLMLSKFLTLGFLLSCLSPNCNLFETFTMYGHYAGKVEDISIVRLATVSYQ